MYYLVIPDEPPIIISCYSSYDEAEEELLSLPDSADVFIVTEKEAIDLGCL